MGGLPLALALVALFAGGAQVSSTSSGQLVPVNSPLRRLIYDDNYMRRVLDSRLPYLRVLDAQNQTIGYRAFRDYFNMSKVYWPDEAYMADKNVEQYLYEELRAVDATLGIFFTTDHWQYSDADELARSGGPEANETRCALELAQLRGQLERAEREPGHLYEPGARQIELLRWIDAWGRPPSESQWGNTLWQGSYRACMEASVPLEEEEEQKEGHGRIGFNFCWAKLLAKDWPEVDEMVPRVTVRAAMCLPRSCDTLMARRHRGQLRQMLGFNFSPIQRQRYLSRPIEDVYCLPLQMAGSTRAARLPFEARLWLALTGLWLALVCWASLRHSWGRSSQRVGASRREQLAVETDDRSSIWVECLERLAVQRTWQEFQAEREPRETGSKLVDLRVLGLIKLAACLMVLIAHCNEYSYWFFHSSSFHIIVMRLWRSLAMHSLSISMDLFMITSGILSGFTLLAKFPKQKLASLLEPKSYLATQLVRYLRLAPLLVYLLSFQKALFKHLGSGPFWDHATYELSHQGRCRQASWWRHLLLPIVFDLSGSGGDANQNECMPSSWYVITDLRMSLLGPVYLCALCKFKRLRLPMLAATLLASAGWQYVHLKMQPLFYFKHLFQYGAMHVTSITVGYFETSYYSPLSRFHNFGLGLFAALQLQRYKRGKIAAWPWFMRGLWLWLAFAWLIYTSLVRPTLAELHYRQTGQFAGEARLLLESIVKQRLDTIIIIVFILRLTTDWSRGVMRSGIVLFKLSKLSYCVYIVHHLLIHYTLSATQFSRPDTEPLQTDIWCTFIITISFAIALPVYLLIEAPLALILDLLLRNRRLKSCGSDFLADGRHIASCASGSSSSLAEAEDRKTR